MVIIIPDEDRRFPVCTHLPGGHVLFPCETEKSANLQSVINKNIKMSCNSSNNYKQTNIIVYQFIFRKNISINNSIYIQDIIHHIPYFEILTHNF